MMQLFYPDVSKYQVAVDDRYSRRWFGFRCCDGTLHDERCDVNKTWSERALREGRLLGWTAYMVYRPGRVQAILDHAAMLPAGGHAEVDVESWGGAIRGDHSDEINRLASGLQKLFPGQLIPGLPRVWRYGNRGDLDSIHPRNTLSLPTRVARYGTVPPTDPHLIGWQYTDGSNTYPVPAGYPRSSAPFGPCDHNVLYLPDAAAGGQPPEDDLSYLNWPQKDRDALSADVATALVNRGLGGVGYNGSVAQILAQTLGAARTAQAIQTTLSTLPALVAAQVKGLPAGGQVDSDAIARAVVTELSQRLDASGPTA